MNRKILVVSLLLLLAATIHTAYGQEGFKGTIFFRNGDSVEFDHVGDLKGVQEAKIYGKLGSQEVYYLLKDLKQIVFSDPDKTYYDLKGTLILINKQGERFTISESSFYAPSGGGIKYVYQDPVTRGLKETFAFVRKNISHIVIGEKAGDIKRNPKTGEYFPAMYLYDPFTGDELEWAKRQ
ncbi:MAG: hypothetical protein QG657_1452 [Acidobacteriota bacterium]|nr:hypothetical protein [Acidobacteriota bacterium]